MTGKQIILLLNCIKHLRKTMKGKSKGLKNKKKKILIIKKFKCANVLDMVVKKMYAEKSKGF